MNKDSLIKGNTMINHNEIINNFKEMLAKQTKVSNLIENKNIFHKQYIQPFYEQMKSLPHENKKELGKEINTLKVTLEDLFNQKKIELEDIENNKENIVNYDLSLNTFCLSKGSKTIISIVTNDIIEYFKNLNFQIVEDSEIVTIDENMN